ncbi:heme A synthase [Aliikangiella sp. G2MR2-5]|uniref:COX15/CtaA family protein n=1 Tax=Aliikangiella sp. G2MR2-5 TaxID=2788943 RepID=UPI0018AB5636|nr:COX15/CtaA family protein [Aliikangiella sp. G2MR2-5]
MSKKLIRNIAIFATGFAMIVVILGAFTRLSDAGLGCPDWPGCYGFMHIPTKDHHIEQANQAFPEQPYQFEKAWPEMVHRYFAGTLGLMVLALAVFAWRSQPKQAVKHSTFLLCLITFQAALGMWTVTMKLHPSIVMLHLMGGITTFSLLAALSLRYHFRFVSPINPGVTNGLKKLIWFTLVVVVLQVALGGWTSANYAAMSCLELPICQGNWLSDGEFINALQMWGFDEEHFEYGIHEQNARVAIHAMHRIGAIVTTLVLTALIFKLVRLKNNKLLNQCGWLLTALLAIQISLGINNIVSHLPLANAVAHNAVGALLVVTMVSLLTLILMPQTDTKLGEAEK